MNNICTFSVLFGIAVVSALVIFLILRRSLKNVLDLVVKLPSATTFYLRLFLICLILISFASIMQADYDLKEGSAFMEYVWEISEGLASVFNHTVVFLVAFLILITILVSVLKRKND